MRARNPISIWTVRAILAATVLTPCAHAAFEAKNNKLIEWGWDTSASAPNGNPWVQGSVPANIATYESQLAFDGIALDIRQNPPLQNNTLDFYGWNDFGGSVLNISNYSQSISAIQSTPFKRYNANSISLKVVPGNADWYDNSGFASINANAQSAASIIHGTAGGTTVFLDIEDYQSHLWWYDNFTTAQKNAHTYAQYQSQVRARGQQWLNTINAAFPGATIMLTDGYERPDPTLQGHNDQNGLVPSFIDGLLDSAAVNNNTILDGYEYAYSFRTSAEFESAYNDMRVNQRNVSANQTSFDAHYRASFGLWLDYNSPTIPWSSSNPSTNYFTPDKFQFAVQEAAKRSDGQVWIYSQTPSWYYPTVAWSNGMAVPQAYKDALSSVRRKGQLERFSGTLADTGTWSLHAQSGATMAQNNSLTLSATSGEADFTTNSITATVRDLVSAEVNPTTSGGSAVVGLALTNDSGGLGNSLLNDSRMLFIEWSDSRNGIYAGVSDSTGSNQLALIAAGDHPLGHMYVYQIERLDSLSAKFSVWDSDTGALVGSPVTRTFSGIPDSLKPGLFSQSGAAIFDNVWIGNSVPEPTTRLLIGASVLLLNGRSRRGNAKASSR